QMDHLSSIFLLAIVSCAFVGCRPNKPDIAPGASGQSSTNSIQLGAAGLKSEVNVLVFRNTRSWNRKVDFEEQLTNHVFPFDDKSADQKEKTDLSRYQLVIIPRAQGQTDYYDEYNQNTERFDEYVAKGGTLVFELNGAEGSNLLLPLGVKMIQH